MFLLQKSDRVYGLLDYFCAAKFFDDVLPFFVIVQQDQIWNIENPDQLRSDEIHTCIPSTISSWPFL